MTTAQIVYLVCGIVFILFSVLLVWYLIYRIQNPYPIEKIENTNWLMKWIRVNIVVIIAIAIVMVLVSAIAFLTMVGAKT
ncbi:MAG: hypothetical protein IJK72_02945 [Mycoplasma sp.]|nr:hypothetical protein [Mycoplasma sp.]